MTLTQTLNRTKNISRQQVYPISPLRKDFLKFIDSEIRPLISLLKEKNLMVISSCQGHSLIEPRYITLAFASGRSRSEFENKILELLPGKLLTLQRLETLTREKISGKIIVHGDRDNEIKGCNFLFNQNRSYFCFLKITIGMTVDFDQNLNTSIPSQIRVIFHNLFKRSSTTKNFEKILRSFT